MTSEKRRDECTVGECCAAGGVRRTRVAGPAGASGLSALLLVLAPKCPLCVTAWLSALGMGAGVAGALGTAATFARPMALAVVALAVGTAAWQGASRRRRKARGNRLA